MARFRYDEVDNYGGQGGAGFFQLKEDKEVASVRFMYNSIEDIEGMSVHEIQLNGKKRYVNCLRSYNQPVDDCPFCRNKMFTAAKLFIPVYDIDSGSVKIWERGKSFFGKMTSLCARYPDVIHHIFEVERNGKPKEQTTTYEIYEVEKDDTTLEDLPELPKILGGLVLDKSADDMEYYLETGNFPPEEEEEVVVKRRDRVEEKTAPTGRRTPATRRSRDAF